MKKQFNPWEENLGKRLQNLQGAPAFDAWDRIEAELEDKPRRPWLLIAAAIALLITPAGLWIWHADDAVPLASHTQTEKTIISESTEIAANSEKPASETAESASSGSVAGVGADRNGAEKKTDDHNSITIPHQQASKQSSSVIESAAIADNSQPAAGSGPAKAANKASIAGSNGESGTTAGATVSSNDADVLSGLDIAAAGKAVPSRAGNHAPDTESSTLSGNSTPVASADKGQANTPALTTAAPATPADVAAATPGTADIAALQPTATLPNEAGLTGLVAKAPEADMPELVIEVPEVKLKKENPTVVVHEKSKKQRLLASLWIEAQPTLSYSRVEPSKTDGIIITSLASEPAVSGSRMGGQLAAGVSYPLMKSLNWKSGAYYWYQQQRLSYTYHNATPDTYQAIYASRDMLSYSARHFEQTQTIEKVYHNVGLSTGLNFKLPTRFVNSFLDTEAMLHYNGEQNISTFLSIGYSVKAKLEGNMAITVGPAVQFQLNNNQNLSPHFQEKPVILGLQMGVLLND